ncbi:MAG: type II toxin-antitoxin system RelE/ParE family toxin [Candidatus Didemnitutus sp.]|nr:type II toxin-antitoxin system RelE/ParE family toxin [Candidatus Didemnitutus sp.]
MDYKVVYTAQVERDLSDIVSFLAAKNPAAAEKTGHALLDAAESLGSLPYRGPVMKGRPSLRKFPHLPYHIIIYQVDEPARLVEILRIWDGRRNPHLFLLP